MNMASCWECGMHGIMHKHHVVPRSRGGTRTLPLCEACHGKVHGKNMLIGALVKRSMTYKRARGERVGAVPYGYQIADDGVHLVEHAAEQEVMRAARELRARGKTLRAVADALAERGIMARNGRKFLPTQLNRLMRDQP